MTKKKIISILFVFLLCFGLFAQNALIDRYLDAANDNLAKREYKKSFDYINYVLSQYPYDQVPQNVELLAENIYYSYLLNIREQGDTEAFNTVKEKLLEYDFLSTERVSRIVRVINAVDSQIVTSTYTEEVEDQSSAVSSVVETDGNKTKENAKPTSSAIIQSSRREAELKKQLEVTKNELSVLEKVLQMAREDREKDTEKQLLAEQKRLELQKEAFEAALKAKARTDNANNTMLFLILCATVALIIIIFIILIIVNSINARNYKKQQEQFEATMELVTRIVNGGNGAIGIGADDNLRSVGSSKLGTVALPQIEMTDSEREIIRDLSIKCEKLGSEVDSVTGRKNNSKNVAETVFKICTQLELPSLESSLYFCAAMVYDSGFLLIDNDLLKAPQLTDEEKSKIRSHVKKGIEQVTFVPKQYRKIFENAVLMHHENMDGTGYPNGISGEEIPIVARILRVAESFVALVSRRNYRGIYDKESAIEELKSRPNLYDANIVKALDDVL